MIYVRKLLAQAIDRVLSISCQGMMYVTCNTALSIYRKVLINTPLKHLYMHLKARQYLSAEIREEPLLTNCMVKLREIYAVPLQAAG